MSLAGGLAVGDRVACRGLPGTVVGGPARAACIRLSVAVRYDDGRIADERVANLELLVDGPGDDEEDEQPPPQMRPAVDEDYGGQERQQVVPQALWAEPPQNAAATTPAVFAEEFMRNEAEEEASPADSPESPYDDRGDDRELPPNNFGPGTQGYGPDEAEAALREKIYANYDDLRAAFRAMDQSNNGYVTREDFFQAMGNIFLSNGFSEDDVYEVADRFDLNRDGYISFNEFVALVEGDNAQQNKAANQPAAEEQSLEDDPQIVTAVERAIQQFKCAVDQRYVNTRKAFLAFDTERRSALSPQNFAKGFIAHGIYLSPPELELAWSLFDRNGTGQISYTDFCAVMTQRLQFGSHLERQLFM